MIGFRFIIHITSIINLRLTMITMIKHTDLHWLIALYLWYMRTYWEFINWDNQSHISVIFQSSRSDLFSIVTVTENGVCTNLLHFSNREKLTLYWQLIYAAFMAFQLSHMPQMAKGLHFIKALFSVLISIFFRLFTEEFSCKWLPFKI